ncbi:hypothetical protein ACRXCV_01510 [Halobacteriovorax sp. GFR7]|uniref:hypothetical protein n=2 Tax=unclassified Halobacteriovorax TaxID=2639665 RepID=UPI003718EA3D
MELVLLTSLIFFIILGVVLGYPLFFKPKMAQAPFKKLNRESHLAKSNLTSFKTTFKLLIVFQVIAMITVVILGAQTLDFFKEAYSILIGLATILILLIL